MNKGIWFLSLVSVQLFGCQAMTGVSNVYPRDWPPIQKLGSEQCVRYSGRYQNDGESSHQITRLIKRELSYYTFDGIRKHNGDPTIGIVADEVEVRVVKERIYALTFREGVALRESLLVGVGGSDVCRNGGLRIQVASGLEGSTFGGGVGASGMRLWKAEDGSLIGEVVSGGAGLAMWLVPMGGYQKLWLRWKLVR